MALLGREGRLNQRWSFDLGSHILCSPSVAELRGDGEEYIIAGTKSGKVVVLDQNANPKWQFGAGEKIDDVEMMFMDSESVNSVTSSPFVGDINGNNMQEVIFGTELGVVY